MKATALKQLLFAPAHSQRSPLLMAARACFSQDVAAMHKKQHMGKVMDPRFYEDEFMAGKSSELEYVRHPFYDMARAETLDKEAAETLMDEITMKLSHIEGLEILLEPPVPTRENVAYTRYSDKPDESEPASRDIFEFPKGKPYQIINKGELFRVQKWSVGEDRWAPIRRSKAFLAGKFIPPFAMKEQTLKALVDRRPTEEGAAFDAWKEEILAAVPRLNHDILVELALHLAYEAKCNDKQIWEAIEDAAVASLHHMNITQVSQLEWATMELKPKQVSARLNTLLQKRANESLEGASLDELMAIMQGFRQRKSKDLYQKMRKVLISRKAALFPAGGNEKQRAENMVNLLYSFASNKPN